MSKEACRYPDCQCPLAWGGKGKPPPTVCLNIPDAQKPERHLTRDEQLSMEIAMRTSGTVRVTLPAVPDGWKLVPIEPTEKMLNLDLDGFGSFQKVWKYILEATPQPEPVKEET